MTVAVETTEVRNLRPTEQIPADLLEGFPLDWEFDEDWVWVAIEEDEIAGYLLTAPCHGVLILVMLKMKPGKGHLIRRLIHKAEADALDRGLKGYMVYFNREKPEQGKLWKIASRWGARILPYKIVCVAGKLQARRPNG